MATLRTLFGILFLLMVMQSNAQTTFAKLYTATGYDYGRDVIESFQDSGLVVTGSSSSFTTETADVLLLKTDSLGNFEWSQAYGSSGSDWGHKIVQTQDTGYAIAGYTNSYGAGGFDFYLIKTDQNGQKLWDTTFGGSDWDIAHSLIELPNKDLVVVGETQSFGNGNKDGYIVCVDSAGGFKWEKTYGGVGDEVIKDINYNPLTDTVWMVGNAFSNFNSSQDGWVLNFDLNTLDTLYSLQIGDNFDDGFNAVDANSNKVYFGGYKSVTTTNKNHWSRGYENGQLLFDVSDNYPENDALNDLEVEHSSGAIHCTGYTESNGYALIDAKKDIFFDARFYYGAYVNYKKNFGGAGDDEGHGVVCTSDQFEVYVGDLSELSTGGNGIILLKMNYGNHDQELVDVQNMQITTSNDDNNKFSEFKIYPNPFESYINISSKNKIIDHLEVYSIDGRSVYHTSNLKNNKVENLGFLNSGIYVIRLFDKQGSVLKSSKILKN